MQQENVIKKFCTYIMVSIYYSKPTYLIPCPGPHLILSIDMLVDPGPMDMQSSPVAMVVLMTLTRFENPMWIPSVLGLSPGAINFILCIVTSLHPLIWTWTASLLSDLKPLTSTSSQLWSESDWNHKIRTKFYQFRVRKNLSLGFQRKTEYQS